MNMAENDTKDTLSDAELQEKATERRFIDTEREKYLEKGGTIKVHIPPFQDGNYYHADVFIPGEGSIQSEPGVTDTMERKPRPPKRFGKK